MMIAALSQVRKVVREKIGRLVKWMIAFSTHSIRKVVNSRLAFEVVFKYRTKETTAEAQVRGGISVGYQDQPSPSDTVACDSPQRQDPQHSLPPPVHKDEPVIKY
jgi:hypothetical protein